MSTVSDLEFLLVSNDYATLTAVSGGMKKYGAKFDLVPTAEAAREFLVRKRIDGLFVDMQVPGALELIEAVRKGSSNGKAAIFACIQSAAQTTATLNAGANFVLRAPLSVDGVSLHITIAKDIMMQERRRFFRHPVSLALSLKDGEGEQRGRIINLSEGGMAVRAARALNQWSVIQFGFELSLGVEINGKGQVAWTSSEGMAGILFQTLQGMGRGHLGAWLAGREGISRNSEQSENSR
jgi:ActR/RegA family two-component response regulator